MSAVERRQTPTKKCGFKECDGEWPDIPNSYGRPRKFCNSRCRAKQYRVEGRGWLKEKTRKSYAKRKISKGRVCGFCSRSDSETVFRSRAACDRCMRQLLRGKICKCCGGPTSQKQCLLADVKELLPGELCSDYFPRELDWVKSHYDKRSPHKRAAGGTCQACYNERFSEDSH